MKALSVQQPWAQLLCAGIKDVENRTWNTQHRGRVLIHASSKKVSKKFLGTDCTYPEASSILNAISLGAIPTLDALETSSVIGYVDIVDSVVENDSLWGVPSEEVYKWKIGDAYLFDEPIRGIKGKLHFFDIPEIDENNLPSAHKVHLQDYIWVDGKVLTIKVEKECFESAKEIGGLKEVYFDYAKESNIFDMLFADKEKEVFEDSISTLKLLCGDRQQSFVICDIFLDPIVDDEGKGFCYTDFDGNTHQCMQMVIQYCREDELDDVEDEGVRYSVKIYNVKDGDYYHYVDASIKGDELEVGESYESFGSDTDNDISGVKWREVAAVMGVENESDLLNAIKERFGKNAVDKMVKLLDEHAIAYEYHHH